MADLRIATDKVIGDIQAYLRDLVDREGAEGVAMGLSGGLDSAVLAALAVRSLGPERVRVVYISDRDSDPESARNARLVADRLELDLETADISSEMADMGVYAPLFVRLLRLSPLVARVAAASYARMCGESTFRSSLRVGAGEALAPWWKRVLYDLTVRHIDEGFAKRHVFRRAVLERLAAANRLLPVGAANLSEISVGWFVRDGIDDLPVEPLGGLYKTQVRQLASALDLPEPVLNRLPSPDMARGITDELGIGHEYRDLDRVLDGFDRGLSDDGIAAAGIPPREISDIRELMRLSDWKRRSPHEPSPVSGRVGSPYRC